MLYRGWLQSKQPLKLTECYGENHWKNFENARKKHNDNICNETNKLVLRLDKLINYEGSNRDKQASTDLDRSVVEWTSDDLVKLCPYCAKAFTIARRRHHCRVCGAITCHNCSRFLDSKSAQRLVRPAKLYTDPYDRIEDSLKSREAEEKPGLRICEDCKRLLDRRLQTIEDHYSQPVFCEIYERLRKTMDEADELMLSYNTLICDQKQGIAELKSKIQSLQHDAAGMAAKLNKMANSGENSEKQAYLLRAISQSVNFWIRESISDKENRVYGARRATNGVASSGGAGTGWVSEQPRSSRINRTASNNNASLSSSTNRQSDNDSNIDKAGEEDEHPLLIQINNLEDYIRQARAADRYEEVSALEANKRELEIEYYFQSVISLDESCDEKEGKSSDLNATR